MAGRRFSQLIALTTIIALVPAGAAYACSCVPLSTETVAEADAAAIAKLLAVEPAADGNSATFTYRVKRVLDGARRLDRGRIRVRAPLSSAACGLPTDKRRYGLVLGRHAHRWTASLCSVTTPQGLRALVAGEEPRVRYCGGTRR